MFNPNRLNLLCIASAICLVLEGVILRLLLCETNLLFELLHLAFPIAVCLGIPKLLLKHRRVLQKPNVTLHWGISSIVAGIVVFLAGQTCLPRGVTIPAYGSVLTIFGAAMILCSQRRKGLAGVVVSTVAFVVAIGLSVLFDCTIGVVLSAAISCILLPFAVCKRFKLEKSLLRALVLVTVVSLLVLLVMVLMKYYDVHIYRDEMMPDRFYRGLFKYIGENAGFFNGVIENIYQFGSVSVLTDELFVGTDEFILLHALNDFGWFPIVMVTVTLLVFAVSGLGICLCYRGHMMHFGMTVVLVPVVQLVLFEAYQFGISPVYMSSAVMLSQDGFGLIITLSAMVVAAIGISHYEWPDEEEDLVNNPDRLYGEMRYFFMDGIR